MSRGRVAMIALACLIAAGCSTAGRTRTDTPGAEAPPAPARPPSATGEFVGKASWYGDAHNGRKTASGETYDMSKLTAAHRTLPMGTRVRVINEANGRSVVVRINDRGPYRPGRIIDLSHAAAKEIGAVGAGVVTVRLEVLGD